MAEGKKFKRRVIDMTGKTYNELTVIERAGYDVDGSVTWLCRCSCGKLCVMRGSNIRNGRSKSCGHTRKTKLMKHGESGYKSNSPLYAVWSHMMYDARHGGAPVCKEWKDPVVFFEWAHSRGWRKGLFFSRINVLAGWYPENATFTTKRNKGRPKNTKIKPIPRLNKEGKRKPQ